MADLALVTGVGNLVLVAALGLLTALTFMVGISVTPWHLPAATLVCLGYLWLASSRSVAIQPWLSFLLALVLQVGMASVSLALSGHFFDLSIDGQTYHQEAIIHLVQGWNPFRDEPLIGLHSLWNNCYAKGPEIASATLYALMGQIEYGKAFNVWLLLGAYLVALGTLLSWMRLRTLPSIVLAGLVAFNPVSLYQSMGFYVDGQLASLLTSICMLLCLALLRPNVLVWIGLASGLVIVANVKFTGLVYAGILVAGSLALLAYQRRGRRSATLAIVSALAVAAGLCVSGFNPYVTNFLRHGHPLYPLMGQSAVHFMAENMPVDFQGKNRLYKFAKAHLAVSANPVPPMASRLKPPFYVAPEEWTIFFIPDARMGGFGPWFSGAALMALLLWVALARHRHAVLGIAFSLLVLVSALANPESWWARYAPQVWLLPLIPLALSMGSEARPWRQALSWILMGVMVGNVGMVSWGYFSGQLAANRQLRGQFSAMRRHAQPALIQFNETRSNRVRLFEQGLPFREVAKLPSEGQLQFTNSNTFYVLPR